MEFKSSSDLSPLRDFLDEVNERNSCGLGESDMSNIASVMGENGFGLVRDIKSLSSDWLSALGMPPGLVEGVRKAFQSLTALPEVDLVPESIALTMAPAQLDYDGLSSMNVECLELLRRRVCVLSQSAGSNDYLLNGLRNMLSKDLLVDEIGDPCEGLTDEVLGSYLHRARLSTEFWADVIGMGMSGGMSSRPASAAAPTCGLCHKTFTGPSQTLECSHQFCPPCINHHINHLVEHKSESANDLKCPVAACGREISAAVIETLLMPNEYQRYLAATFASFIESDETTFECPHETCKEVHCINTKPKPITTPIKEETDDGRKLTKDEYQHFMMYRVRCNACKTNFCAKCKFKPYHKGFTCDSHGVYLKSKHCRFCKTQLSPSNTMGGAPTLALADCCTDPECVTKRDYCCDKMKACGCPCNGIRGEETCLPCLKCELKVADEWCTICYSEELSEAPCIQMTGCKHIYHLQCVKGKLEAGPSGARVQFEFMKCSQDRVVMDHPGLRAVLGPILKKKNEIETKSLQRLQYEGRMKDKKLFKKDAPYYNDPTAFALHEYVFYDCFKCKKPYFAGGYQCDPSDNLWDPEELVCARCQPKCVKECAKHGTDWIAYKCRYCCSTATFFCWGKTRFCANCHKPDAWKKLATYKTGANKLKIWEYPQCPGLKDKVAAIGYDRSLNDQQKEAKLEKVFSDPRTCPLKTRHPPNGMEFGMGCSMCQDKEHEEENIKAASAAADEKKGVFRHTSDFDTSGIIHHIGTNMGRVAWVNPASKEWIKITSSQLIKGSHPATAICGRSSVKCVAQAQKNAWYLLNFIDKAIEITHYSLRHIHKSDTDALRNWSLLGSLDGKNWTKLSEHANDTFLGRKSDTHTWPVTIPKAGPPKFRCFCIMQTGPNASGRLALCLSGVEVYGKLTRMG